MKTLKSLYMGENPVNFPKLWKKAFICSIIVLAMGIGSFGFRGLNLGLDFEGGTSYEVRAAEVTVSDTREVLATVGASDSRVQKVGTDIIRIRSDIDNSIFSTFTINNFICSSTVTYTDLGTFMWSVT